MTTERSIALALPDEAQFRHDIQAINRFQQIVHSTMVNGLDYGIIPGTQKPTLLKPGAEKIAKLLGLSDQYEIVDKAEDWQKPFFRYLIKCRLVHIATNAVISEGLGECNSMESKYRYRWVGERDLPTGVDKSKLVSQERRNSKGGRWLVYRMDNEDIYSQVNTILKMAKKRALVDAALSAGRLSDVFTQDMEDMTVIPDETEIKGKTTKPSPEVKKDIDLVYGETTDATEAKTQSIQGTMPSKPSELPGMNIDDIILQMKEIPFSIPDAMRWFKEKLKIDIGGQTFKQVIAKLTREQQEAFCQKLKELGELKG